MANPVSSTARPVPEGNRYGERRPQLDSIISTIVKQGALGAKLDAVSQLIDIPHRLNDEMLEQINELHLNYGHSEDPTAIRVEDKARIIWSVFQAFPRELRHTCLDRGIATSFQFIAEKPWEYVWSAKNVVRLAVDDLRANASNLEQIDEGVSPGELMLSTLEKMEKVNAYNAQMLAKAIAEREEEERTNVSLHVGRAFKAIGYHIVSAGHTVAQCFNEFASSWSSNDKNEGNAGQRHCGTPSTVGSSGLGILPTGGQYSRY